MFYVHIWTGSNSEFSEYMKAIYKQTPYVTQNLLSYTQPYTMETDSKILDAHQWCVQDFEQGGADINRCKAPRKVLEPCPL